MCVCVCIYIYVYIHHYTWSVLVFNGGNSIIGTNVRMKTGICFKVVADSSLWWARKRICFLFTKV